MKKNKINIILICIIAFLASCQIRFSLNQGNFDGISTFSVQRVTNMAPIVQPTLSALVTEGLKDKIESQSPLNLVTNMGDANFEAIIKDYSTRPVNISGNETASQNRLTIGISVKYTNQVDPELDFDKVFSRFSDYDSSKSLDAVEDELIEEILDQILEDIFNEAFVNW